MELLVVVPIEWEKQEKRRTSAVDRFGYFLQYSDSPERLKKHRNIIILSGSIERYRCLVEGILLRAVL